MRLKNLDARGDEAVQNLCASLGKRIFPSRVEEPCGDDYRLRKKDKKEDSMENTTLFWIVLFTLFWVAIFVIPAFRLRRALLQVIGIFRNTRSLCSAGVKSLDDLGLAPPNIWEGLFRLRDYKGYALQLLIRVGVVQLSEDGKMCLLEEKAAEFLAANRLQQ